MMAEALLGTQGWDHQEWVGPFYPEGTPARERLPAYAQEFRTVEVASSFHCVPAEPVLRAWREQVPPGFLFALRVPQLITHERALAGVEDALSRFLSRVGTLEEALGPLLLQISLSFTPNEPNRMQFRQFVKGLPDGFRFAVEFRHPAWLVAETFDVLRSRNLALVLADGRWIRRSLMLELAAEPTADFTYVRWNGSGERLYGASRARRDRDHELAAWRCALQETLRPEVTVFGYFANAYQGHAPQSVRVLRGLLGRAAPEPHGLRHRAGHL